MPSGSTGGHCANSVSTRSPRGSRRPVGWRCRPSCAACCERGRDLHAEFIKLLPTPPRPIRIQRWSVRRVGLWAAIALLVVLASLNPTAVFDNQVAVRTPLNTGNLSCAHLEPLWLMAQSVPSASLVPCVPSQVPGWKVAEVAVNNGRSVIILDHDRD